MSQCCVCGKPASCYGVRTGRSWFDRIPFLSWVSRLQAMPMRYAIVDDYESGHKYCSTCRRKAESRLEEAHARVRSEHARFNAEQQGQLDTLDHGGLDRGLRMDFDAILQRLDLAAKPNQTRQLAAPEVHVMPATSTAERQGT